MTQLYMTGDDWLSDGDKKRHARAEAAAARSAASATQRAEFLRMVTGGGYDIDAVRARLEGEQRRPDSE
jgi:hypothetical protein